MEGRLPKELKEDRIWKGGFQREMKRRIEFGWEASKMDEEGLEALRSGGLLELLVRLFKGNRGPNFSNRKSSLS